MTMKFLLSISFLTLSASLIIVPEASALTYRQSDSLAVVRLLAKGKLQPASENLTLFYANELLEKPYVGKTLEVNPKEELAVNLRELDCTTLVENVLALVLTTRQHSTRFNDFCRVHGLEKILGTAELDACFQHFGSGLCRMICQLVDVCLCRDFLRIGAITLVRIVDAQRLNCIYMSSHPDRYPMLKGDVEALQLIKENERRVNGRTIHYIPRRLLGKSRKELAMVHDGDILAIVTKKEGLDVSHLGFAVWGTDGKLHLLNASQIHKKVVLEPMTLEEYMKKHPSQLGVRVIRIKADR